MFLFFTPLEIDDVENKMENGSTIETLKNTA
jgi:hypothetical protein